MSEANWRRIGNNARTLTTKEGLKGLAAGAGKTTLDDLIRLLTGRNSGVQRQIARQIGEVFGPKAMRFAGTNPIVKNALRAVPGLGVGMVALDAADIAAGSDGPGNKAMDALGMLGGAATGFVMGGPFGALGGASVGKGLVDSAQGFMGGGKTAEDRKIEELLALLGE